MSQIKKSASFRCRSSLVKSRIPQRLGSSPQLQRKVRHRKASKLSYDNYSTSSFSSGDESNDSDNPIKVIHQKIIFYSLYETQSITARERAKRISSVSSHFLYFMFCFERVGWFRHDKFDKFDLQLDSE